jgi:hypothetical protein
VVGGVVPGWGVTGDPHRVLAFLDFNFSDTRRFEQIDEFFDLANIHRHGGYRRGVTG